MGFKLWIWSLLTGSSFKASLMEGERLIKAKKNIEALDVFREVVSQYPTNPAGYIGLAKTYRAMGLRLEAGREATIADCLERIKDDPEDQEARLDIAEAYFDKDMFGWAATHIEQALKHKPIKDEILLLAARIFRANRNYSKAIAVLQSALKRKPLDADIYEKLAFNLRSANQTAEAVKAATIAKALKTINANPGDAQVLGEAVRQLASVGKTRLGAALVEGAAKGQANDPGMQRLFGEMQLSEHKFHDAILALRRTVQLDPTDIRAHRLLAKAYQSLGEIDKAQHHLATAENMNAAAQGGDQAGTALATVQMLLDTNDLAGAIQRTQAMAATHPQDWRSSYALGLCFMAQEKYAEAKAAFIKSKAAGPKQPGPVMGQAQAHSMLNESLEALGEARRAVHLDPRDAAVRRELAGILRKHGYIEQAVEEEDLADSLDKGDAA